MPFNFIKLDKKCKKYKQIGLYILRTVHLCGKCIKRFLLKIFQHSSILLNNFHGV